MSETYLFSLQKECFLIYYTESFNEMVGAVLQLSEIGTLVEAMNVSALDLLPHSADLGINLVVVYVLKLTLKIS